MHRPLANLPGIMPVAVFLCSVAVALIALHQVAQDPAIDVLRSDGKAYVKWADSILSPGGAPREVFYQAPLYPHLVALERSILGPSLERLRLIQVMVGALGCALVAAATHRLTGSRGTGLLAGMLLAFYPASIAFSLEIDKTVLDLVFGGGLLLALAAATQNPRPRNWALLGVAGGLSALTRENTLVVVIVAAVACLVLFRNETWRWRFGRIGALVAGTAAMLLPVAIRNSAIDGEFHLATAQFGPNFYIGNGREANGVYQPLRPGRGDAEFERTDATELAEAAVGQKLSAGGVSRYWTSRTLAEIRAQPAAWLALMGRKIALVFANTDLEDSPVKDRFIAWSPFLAGLDRVWGFGALAVLSAIGLVALRQRPAAWIPLGAVAAAYAVSVALFFVLGRYRVFLVVLLMPLAAAGLASIPFIVRQRSRRLLAADAFAVAISFGLAWAGEEATPTVVKGTSLANRANVTWIDRKDPDDAIPLYRRAIAENPELFSAYEDLGVLLARKGDLKEAATILAEPSKPASFVPAAQIEMGQILASQGMFAAAADRFWAAVQLEPGNSAGRYMLGVSLLKVGQQPRALEILKAIASPTSPDFFAREAARAVANPADPTIAIPGVMAR